MTSDDQVPQGDTGSAPRAGHNGTVAEVVTVFFVSAIAVAGLDLISWSVPPIRNNLLALVAAVFLFLPIVVLARRGRSDAEYGLKLTRVAEGLKWGLGATLVTLLFFIPGYHLWVTKAAGYQLDLENTSWSRPSDRFTDLGGELLPGELRVSTIDSLLRIEWDPREGPWELRLSGDLPIQQVPNRGRVDEQTKEWSLQGRIPRPVSASFRMVAGGEYHIEAAVDGVAVERDSYRTGSMAGPPPARLWRDGGLRVPVNLSWLLIAVLVQVLLVALPEEFFYRGYLQERLSEAIGRRRLQIGPLFVTTPIVLVSLAFGLGHFLVGFDPSRFAVFFPSLAFGFLREKTDGIIAPIVYHASCNLMVMILSLHYSVI